MGETVGSGIKSEHFGGGFLVGKNGSAVARGGARALNGEGLANIGGAFGKQFSGGDTFDSVIGIINKRRFNGGGKKVGDGAGSAGKK